MSEGFRLLPHTADVRFEAWGPTRESCLAQAVRAFTATFAEISGARPEQHRSVALDAEGDEQLLLAALDELVFLLDTEDAVPLDVSAERTDGGVLLQLWTTSMRALRSTGAAPKAVSLHGLRFSTENGEWRCAVTLDV